MDFASLMKSRMSKSKPTSSSENKYIKRSEIEAERQAAYQARVKDLEEESKKKAAATRKLEEDAEAEKAVRDAKRQKLADESRKRRQEEEWEEEQARRRRLGLPEKERPKDGDADDEALGNGMEDMPEEELGPKLRDIGEPIKLFGESHAARLKRYRKLTTVMSKGPIPTTLQLVEEKDMKVDKTVPKDAEGRGWLFRQLASYFTMILSEYETTMEAEKRDTLSSKAAYNTMVQTRENLRPLFRKFEAADLPDDLLVPMVEIVHALQERRYVDANDGYLRLSIGKAAWPIGVTMVGIHERSAREKLHNGEKGHVMGDEITRKYLQSIKRCVTFAQVRWPPTDLRQLMG